LGTPPDFGSTSALARIFSSEYASPGLSVTQARKGWRSRCGLAIRDTALTFCPSYEACGTGGATCPKPVAVKRTEQRSKKSDERMSQRVPFRKRRARNYEAALYIPARRCTGVGCGQILSSCRPQPRQEIDFGHL